MKKTREQIVIESLKIRKKSHIDELVNRLNLIGISFQDTDGVLDNVVFIKDDVIKKIAQRIFYRYSGICVTYKDDGKMVTMEPFTDELFYDYMYNLIKHLFDL